MSSLKTVNPPPPPGYEEDFAAWIQDQAAKLRARSANALDWDNLAEEIESVGRSQRWEIRNRLRVLLHHLLKWEFQPEGRCASWQSAIGEQRTHIEGLIDTSPSLGSVPEEAMAWAYERALAKAAAETGLSESSFPTACSYSVEDVLNYRFMPGRPWHPDDLIRD